MKTRTSKVNAPVPLLDTRRGGRSDSGPDLAGVADMEAATQAAAHERHLHQVPESSEQEESPGPWRPWQAWGQRWWVRRDTPTDRSARSGTFQYMLRFAFDSCLMSVAASRQWMLIQ